MRYFSSRAACFPAAFHAKDERLPAADGFGFRLGLAFGLLSGFASDFASDFASGLASDFASPLSLPPERRALDIGFAAGLAPCS